MNWQSIALIVVIVLILLFVLILIRKSDKTEENRDSSVSDVQESRSSVYNDLSVQESVPISQRSEPEPYVTNRPPSKGEEECRRVLEKHFNLPFETYRPDWFRNPDTGNKIEIDCYNHKLKLGVEYNGVQHYEAGHFNMTETDLYKQRQRDLHKQRLAMKYGIMLITVPYNIKIGDIEGFLMGKINQGVSI